MRVGYGDDENDDAFILELRDVLPGLAINGLKLKANLGITFGASEL